LPFLAPLVAGIAVDGYAAVVATGAGFFLGGLKEAGCATVVAARAGFFLGCFADVDVG
jgi:hypothetical protein